VYNALQISLTGLPEGTYSITATAAIKPLTTFEPNAVAECVLSAGTTNIDYAETPLVKQERVVTVTAAGTVTFTGTGTLTLTCTAEAEKFELIGGSTSGYKTTITAVKVREGHPATTETATTTTFTP